MKKVVCGMVLVCFLFTYGCNFPILQQNPDRAPTEDQELTDEEASKQRRKAIRNTAWICAGVAATIGYVTSSKNKKLERSLFWGVLGGLGCGLFMHKYTQKLEQERQALKGKEADLDAQLKYARTVNEETKRYNEVTQLEIEDIEHRIEDGKAKKGRVESIQYRLEEDKENLSTTIADLKQYRKGLTKGNAPGEKQKMADLDMQIQELEAQLAVLEQNTQKVASLNKRVTV